MAIAVGAIFIAMFAVLIYLLVNEAQSTQQDRQKAQDELNKKLDRLAEKQKQTNQAVTEIKKQVEQPEVVEATVVKTPPIFYDPPKQAAPKPQPKPAPAPAPKPAPQPKPKQQAQSKPKPQPKPRVEVEVQESLFPSTPLKKGDEVTAILDSDGIYYIDNRKQSGIIWIPYTPETQASIDVIKELFTVKFETRGAIATKGYPAWRVMII